MSKVLFLSHHPHDCHLTYARAIGAKVKIVPFKKYVSLMKSNPVLNLLYPMLSLVYSLFINASQNIILVEGGSALYTAYFLKIRKKSLKIVYIDCDLLFYNLNRYPGYFGGIFIKKVIKKIDFCISGSRQNQEMASRFLDCPFALGLPYPKEMKLVEVERKNFGLYLGRLDPDKNIKNIINFGIQCPYFEKFVVVGSGILTDYVKALAMREPKLIYYPPKEEIAEFYSQCKFLVHLPKHDPYPCTTMEASLCGCFPILSPGVGTRDLFDQIFVVRDPNNFESINQKIKHILDHEEEAKEILRQNAKKIRSKNQSIENFKELFAQIERKLGQKK